ncbi:MAG: DNA polymerase III subunit chi [Marinobacter excellens HL-55]|uniref:DNA polymerase III subunit chi n=1 Tax=Marinobacter excellens HL-55 TaxID=1305731 RepID=A0A0P7Z234_9GAMM|nr:MAG: DNA polymerase III subunit chi [Marinobacter excellens HL-55]
MQESNPTNPPETGSPAAGPSGPDEKNQRYWFHILAQNTPNARNLHAAKLVDKAWQQGDRVCVLCDNQQQAEELDELLWNVTPDAFIPHSIATEPTTPCEDPVGLLLYPPAATDWDTVIILSATLPADASQYSRLALVAHNDPAVLNQAREHFKQLRKLGIEARVHDMRQR